MRTLNMLPVRGLWLIFFLVLVINAIATGANIARSAQNESWVNHTLSAMVELNALSQEVTEAETSIRGYLISGDDFYLKPLSSARASAHGRIEAIRKLVADNPQQSDKIIDVAHNANAKLDNLEKLKMGYQPNRRVTPEELKFLNQGKSIMDRFQTGVQEMLDEETRLLGLRQADAHTSLLLSIGTAIVGTLAAIGTLALVFFQLKRESDIQSKGEKVVLAARAETATAQRQSAETLTLLDSFLINAPLGMAYFDQDLHAIRVNRTLAESFQVSIGECLGRPLSLAIPKLSKAISQDLSSVLQNGVAVLDRVSHHAGPGGLETVWQYSCYPVRDTLGALTGVGFVTRDITERLRDELKLKENEERFRVTAETLPQIVWVGQADGSIEFFNQRWYDYTGMSRDRGSAADWANSVHPEERELARERWQRSIASGEPYEIEYRLRKHSGAYRWFLGRALPILDPANRPTRWFGTATDVHDQKQAKDALEQRVAERTAELRQVVSTMLDEAQERERATEELRRTTEQLSRKTQELSLSTEELQRSTDELSRSNRELEQFAYVASHDLQEPLRKIQAFGDRLQGKCEQALDEQGKEYLERMRNSAGRMRRLIDDLLAYSRVATKTHSFETVNLNEVVSDVLTDLEERVESTGAMVEIGPLPTIDADRVQMRQLFQNLIANALKFRKPGIPPQVTVKSSRLDSLVSASTNGTASPSLRIEVADRGVGFDPAYVGRLFQVFQRLHGRTEYEGTGIGLAVCRKIVERHGGTIVAHGEVNTGATFVITIPEKHTQGAGSEQ